MSTTNGEADGCVVGVDVAGETLGINEGELDGLALLGTSLGDTVGDIDGTVVGSVVGSDIVGTFVGTNVGLEVGAQRPVPLNALASQQNRSHAPALAAQHKPDNTSKSQSSSLDSCSSPSHSVVGSDVGATKPGGCEGDVVGGTEGVALGASVQL